MSNGTLAELPPENIPNNITMPDEPSVMLLLPHNKYLLGTASKWVLSSGDKHQNIFLYDDQVLSLSNGDSKPTVIPKETVKALRRELFSLTEPPGRHVPTLLMLRTLLDKYRALNLFDKKFFNELIKNDLTFCKTYWTLRFALARREFETVRRLKAWLKADPEIFTKSKNEMKLWFSISDIPDKSVINELKKLSFTELEIERIAAQKISPVILYNPVSGWLIASRFNYEYGKKSDTMFVVWEYLSHDLYCELKEYKNMSVNDIILALWGEYETRQAMQERAKYKGDE